MVAGSILGSAFIAPSQTTAIPLLIPALLLTALAAVGGGLRATMSDDQLRGLIIRAVLGAGAIMFGTSLYRLVAPMSTGARIGVVALIVVVVTASFLTLADRAGSMASFAFFLAYAVSLAWVLIATYENHGFIDVALFQRESSVALLEGINPFAITFPDLYGAKSAIFYGPGVSIDGVLQFGFPYLPLSLILVAPFEWLMSDFRVAHALAILGSAILISRLSNDAGSRSAAAAFLMVSPVPFVVTFGWTEPLLILAMMLSVFAATRSWGSNSYLVGVVVSIKQYAVLLLPSSLLLLDRPWTPRRVGSHLAKVSIVVATTTLPFFLWNPEAFTRSVITLQFVQPFRYDAVAFTAWWAGAFGEPHPLFVTFVPLGLVVLVTVATWRRTPTGAQGFALASALTLFVAFAFAKQAFANYYLTVIALLFAASALSYERSGEIADGDIAVKRTAGDEAAGSSSR